MFIDQDKLIEILEGKTNHSFVGIESETTPKCLVKGRNSKIPLIERFNCTNDDIKKVSQFTSMLGLDYRHVIETRLKKEGKDISAYESGETWHQKVEGTKNLRQHKKTGELYVYLFCVSNNPAVSAYYNMKSTKMLDKKELEEYLPVEHEPTNQGLTEGNEVNVRTFKLSSIRKITLDKETYTVK
jgi:hypothetical protein